MTTPAFSTASGLSPRTPVLLRSSRASTCIRLPVIPTPSAARTPQPRMLTLIRSSRAKLVLDADDDGAAGATNAPMAPVHRAEVAAIAAGVCEFMNKEHVRDLANYIVRYGQKFDDLSQLTHVKMTGLDAAGFTTDIVACDETSCVCVQERLDWPLGLCANASDVITALKHLSMSCGLPADF